MTSEPLSVEELTVKFRDGCLTRQNDRENMPSNKIINLEQCRGTNVKGTFYHQHHLVASLSFSPLHPSSLITVARKEDASCRSSNVNTMGGLGGGQYIGYWNQTLSPSHPGGGEQRHKTNPVQPEYNRLPPQQHTHTYTHPQKVCILHRALEDHKSMHEKDVVEIFGGIRVYFCHLCETATHSSRSQLRKKLVTEISSFSSAAKSPACEGREKLTN